jgi:hypothetical protein
MKSKDDKRADSVYGRHPAFAEDRRKEALRLLGRPFLRRSIAHQLLLFAIVLLLWKIPMVNPIKLVVVLVHELSHTIAAYLTGGAVFGIAIDPGGAGITLGMDGNRLLIMAAGYVGSLLFGCLLYILIAHWEPVEIWCWLCLAIGLSPFFGWLNDFTSFFGFATMVLMFVGIFLFSKRVKLFILRWVATTSCLFPVVDVAWEFWRGQAQGFVIDGKTAGSDVAQISALVGIPEAPIALFWIAVGLGAVCFLVVWSARKETATEVKRSLIRRRPKSYVEAVYTADPSNPPEYRIG